MNVSEAALIKRLREFAGPIDQKILDEVFEYEQTIDREWGCCHTAAEIEAGECDASSEIGIVALLGQRYRLADARPEQVGQHHVIAEGALGDQPQTVLPDPGESCPECRAGKHGNCTETVPSDSPKTEWLRWVQCPCQAKGHR